MRLSDPDLRILLELARLAAEEAGRMIASRTGTEVSVQRKAGGSSTASQLVTEVDFASQEIILQHLQPTLQEFDLALLTEETPDNGSRLEKDYFWCVDPLDGTLPFTEGIPGYAVSIALVSREGQPLIAAVFDPVEHVLYSAMRGQGAYIHGKPLRIQVVETGFKPVSTTWIMDRSLRNHPRFAEYHAALERLAGEKGSDLKIVDRGGAVMNALWCLVKAPAVYFKPPRKEPGGGSLWDYAATALIVREAGGHVSDYSGDPLDLNRADSTFMNHGGVCYGSAGSLIECIGIPG